MVTTSTATGSAAPPKKPSSGTSGSARATAAAAEARNPARVMPIWMVDRNWLGFAGQLGDQPPPPAFLLQASQLALAQRDEGDLAAGEGRVDHHQHQHQPELNPRSLHPASSSSTASANQESDRVSAGCLPARAVSPDQLDRA